MPHTPELLDRLREALEISDAAEDHLVSAYVTTAIAVLEEREAKHPDGGRSA
jgi:hypothetical protein